MPIESLPLFTVYIHKVNVTEWQKEGNRILSMVPFNSTEKKENHIDYTDYFSKSAPPYAEETLKLFQPYLDDFLKVSQYKFTHVSGLWCQRYKSSNYHPPHDHGAFGYSCVFYARINPKVHKSTLFFSPFAAESGSRDTSSIAVEEGDLVIFPSGLLHMAPPHDSDQDRIIISLNLL